MHAGRGVASNHYLLDIYQKTLEGYFRMWHHHFEFLLLGYGAYMTFFAFCKKAFPEITDQTIARMVAGIEAEIFRPGRRAAAARAPRGGARRGLERSRTACRSTTIIGALRAVRASPAASGSRSSRRRAIPGSTSTSATASITTTAPGTTTCRCRSPACPSTCGACRAGESLDRPVEKLQAERRQLIDDYRELLATDDERAAYDQMITLAHRVFPYVEGHKFYCEHWYTNLFFNKIREFGALLATHGFFADAEDVFQLDALRARVGDHRPDERLVDRLAAARSGALAGDRGGAPGGDRGVGEARHAAGARAGAGRDRRSGDRHAVGHHARESRHLAATRTATSTATRSAGSPRRAASSKARRAIVKSVEEIARLQKGDILVCQVTNPTWAPIFQKIAGAVSDIGGSMSHAAIVAREYGLPAVVGTGTATSRIKDGQRIRVDGGRGVVTILE